MNPQPLIHIGLHKTGTTWLQDHIFTQARFGFTQVGPRTLIDEAFLGGNPYAFDPAHARSLLDPFVAQAAATSTVPVVSHEPLSGRLILNAFDSKTIADRLHATAPDARILIVIREQQSMMLSTYKQYVRTGGTLKPHDMWRAYEPEERRLPTPGLDAFEYDRIIAYYQGLFGKGSVLVLPFELLKADDERFLKEITTFVGLDAPTDIPRDRSNVAIPGSMVRTARATNVVLRGLGLLGRFGGPIRNVRLRTFVYRSTDRIGSVLPKGMSRRADGRLTNQIEMLANARFEASNRQTIEITGLDLASYGYAL